jgi:hypothetical protein
MSATHRTVQFGVVVEKYEHWSNEHLWAAEIEMAGL